MRPDIICFATRTFVHRDPHWYPSRVKEDSHIRLHPNNINRDSEIEISEAWCLHVRPDSTTADRYLSKPLKKHYSPLIMPAMLRIETHQPLVRFVIHQSLNISNHGGTNSHSVNRHYRLMETWSTRSKQRD